MGRNTCFIVYKPVDIVRKASQNESCIFVLWAQNRNHPIGWFLFWLFSPPVLKPTSISRKRQLQRSWNWRGECGFACKIRSLTTESNSPQFDALAANLLIQVVAGSASRQSASCVVLCARHSLAHKTRTLADTVWKKLPPAPFCCTNPAGGANEKQIASRRSAFRFIYLC